MNETLIANWNRKVHGNDTVYILGDMFFRTTDPEPILRQLKGKKHLITGNHDSQWMKKVDLGRWFASIQPYLETTDGQHTLKVLLLRENTLIQQLQQTIHQVQQFL